MKPFHLLTGSLALVATAFVLPDAVAKPAYRTTAIEQLKLTPDKDGKQTVTCQYCHVAAFGGSQWNGFGNAVRAEIRGAAGGNVGQALYLVLKANKDADRDGYTDAIEVFAKTLPGDSKSKPSKTVAALQKELAAAGGVDQYKPKP
jgi:hypothetical protein